MQPSRYIKILSATQAIAHAAWARDDPRAAEHSRRLALRLQELGPTFVKLGQMLSSRPDLFSQEYLTAFQRLQDAVEPFPAPEAVAIVEEELGGGVDDLFGRFERKPNASASLAQVHYAESPRGEQLAVKVRRPGISDNIRQDIFLLRAVSSVLQRTRAAEYFDFPRFVSEFERNIALELNFSFEAGNIAAIANNLRNFEHILIPRVWVELSTDKVLTTDWISGKRIDERSCSAFPEEQRKHLAHELLRAYLKQVVEDGFFHADPHEGNVLITEEGRLALIDLGIVGSFDETTRERIGKLLFAFAALNSDEVVAEMLTLGTQTEQTNTKELLLDVREVTTRYHHLTARQLGLGKALIDLTTAALRHHLRLPAGFTLLGRTFFYLDRLCLDIDPSLDYTEFLDKTAPSMYVWFGQRQFGRQKLAQSAFEAGRLITESAGKLNILMEKLVSDRMAIRFEHEHLQDLTETLKRAANRLSFALVIGALIMGSALLARLDIGPKFLGMSILGVGGFSLAALFGIYLLIKILSGERL